MNKIVLVKNMKNISSPLLIERELSHIVGAGEVSVDYENSKVAFSAIDQQAERNVITKLNNIGLEVTEN